jgi:hypothetical protein
MTFTLTLQQIKHSEKDYLIVQAPEDFDWLEGKTSSLGLRLFLENLHGYANMILSKKVEVIEISEETYPEYYI